MRPCHGRDRGFESRRLRQFIADVAELADAHGSGPCRVTTPGGSSSLPICTSLAPGGAGGRLYGRRPGACAGGVDGAGQVRARVAQSARALG